MFKDARLPLLLALLVVLLVGLPPERAMGVGIGDAAPDFRLMDIYGGSHMLSGCDAPVLVMFFEYDDATALSLAPQVQTVFVESSYSSQGLLVFGIETSGCSPAELSAFKTQTGVSFPLLLDGGPVLSEYGLPQGSFVLVDAKGIVRYAGAYDEPTLEQAVSQAVQDAATAKAITWGVIKSLYK